MSPVWTERLAIEVLPADVCADVTVTLLVMVSAMVPLTFSEIVHEPAAGKLAPDRLSEAPPPFAATVPPQLLVRLLGNATASPDGKLSVNATPERAELELGLLMLIVKLVTPFSGMLGTPNACAICGGSNCTGITSKFLVDNEVLPA
jgi:hypothetical protein